MKKKLVFVLLAAALVIFVSAPRHERFVVPVYAGQEPAPSVDSGLLIPPTAWLHVEVETNWAWFWQISKGHAWVTADKQDTLPVEVGKLTIRLTAHDTNEKTVYGMHEVNVTEKKRGVQIAKRTAIATAWTDVPALDTVTVRMQP